MSGEEILDNTTPSSIPENPSTLINAIAMRTYKGSTTVIVHRTNRPITSLTCPHYRYISSNGLVSRKQLSHTSLTTFPACSWSFMPGLAIILNVALRLTHDCSCSVMRHWFRVKNSLEKRHSPLSVEARISRQAWCRRFSDSTLNFRWSHA